MFVERQGLIVWLHSTKHTKVLQKFGNIHYVSRKLKYAVLYCNQDDAEKILTEVSAISFVKSVELSNRNSWQWKFEGKKLEHERKEEFENIELP